MQMKHSIFNSNKSFHGQKQIFKKRGFRVILLILLGIVYTKLSFGQLFIFPHITWWKAAQVLELVYS